MTKKEFAVFAMALKTYFPRDNLLPTEEAMELWYRQLSDIPYETASAMLGKWVVTQKWPPSIAEIRSMCSEIVMGTIPDWGEAWQEVLKAVGSFGYMRESEALVSLSPTAQSAVRKIGWQGICFSENQDVLRAQFRQVYEICAEREQVNRQLPPALKETIAAIGQNLSAALPKGRKE